MVSFFKFLERANRDATVFRKDGSQVQFGMDGTVTIQAGRDLHISGKKALSLNDYQDGAISTAVYADKWKVIYPALKLTGEAGEVSEKIGKNIRDGDGTYSDEFKKELAKELGDVLWYIAALSRDLGYTLEDIGQMNLDKLASRKARGTLSGSGDNR